MNASRIQGLLQGRLDGCHAVMFDGMPVHVDEMQEAVAKLTPLGIRFMNACMRESELAYTRRSNDARIPSMTPLQIEVRLAAR